MMTMITAMMVMMMAMMLTVMTMITQQWLQQKSTCLLSAYWEPDRWVSPVEAMIWDLFCLKICNKILMVRINIEMIKQMMRPDSKRALIFWAMRADSGDCGSNLNFFKNPLKWCFYWIWECVCVLEKGLVGIWQKVLPSNPLTLFSPLLGLAVSPAHFL